MKTSLKQSGIGASTRFPRVVLNTCAMALMIPITGAYFWSFLLLCWLVVARPGRADRTSGGDDTLTHAWQPIHWGALALIGTQVVASLVAYFSSEFAQPLPVVLMLSLHMLTKFTVLWFVLAAGQRAMARRGYTVVREGAPWLFGFLCIHLAYCLVQRETGIDWTHGFHATLGQHRFAYGVYRVSGFHGHPLTLSYNLMLLVLAATWVVTHARTALPSGTRRLWFGILAVSLVTLVITGSRFPLAALALALLACEWRRLWKHKWWVLGLAGVMVLALALEGSTVGRVQELFDQKVPLTERFPRFVFWQVHWRMFLDHPLAGVGMAGVDRAYEVYYAGIEPSDKMYSAHDIFLQLLADTGLIGLTGLVALLAGFAVAARRLEAAGADGSALRYLAAAAIFSGLLQNNFRDSEFLYAFWFLTAALSVPFQAHGGAAQRAELREHGKSPQNFQSPTRPPDSAAHLSG